MSQKEHYVIIGNGPAGNAAADALRESDSEARITIVSDEMFTFYYRHLLPNFLAGGLDAEKLKVRPYTVYKDKNIRLRLGQRVEKIDPESKTLYLKHMELLHYTKLLLAVGGVPKVPPYLERYRERLTFVSRYEDAVKLKPALEKAKSVLVLGGDLVSLSVTKQLLAMKKKVHFLLDGESFWPLNLTGDMEEKIQHSLKVKGVECRVHDDLKTIAEKGENLKVETDGGKEYSVDMICCFMGIVPNISFVLGSGINTERGVLVDDNLRTNYKDVYACGDCAQIYSPKLKNYWVSIGCENAEIQGETAAMNLLGDNRIIKPAKKKILMVDGLKVSTPWWKEF